MRRERLRPAHSSAGLDLLYPEPTNHFRWIDHRVRVAVTKVIALGCIDDTVASGADLSCGDGAILRGLNLPTAYFGDYAPGHEYTGPIEETIEQVPAVDLFVCTETVEHLDDPDAVLKSIGWKADRLLLSTPIDAWGDGNAEHYWAWDREAVEEMIRGAGFRPVVFTALDLRPGNPVSYQFGIWGCVS